MVKNGRQTKRGREREEKEIERRDGSGGRKGREREGKIKANTGS